MFTIIVFSCCKSPKFFWLPGPGKAPTASISSPSVPHSSTGRAPTEDSPHSQMPPKLYQCLNNRFPLFLPSGVHSRVAMNQLPWRAASCFLREGCPWLFFWWCYLRCFLLSSPLSSCLHPGEREASSLLSFWLSRSLHSHLTFLIPSFFFFCLKYK